MPKDRKNFDELDFVAEQLFDYSNSVRMDNLGKDGCAGDPRKVSCKYEDLTYDQQFHFWRMLARWHLVQVQGSKDVEGRSNEGGVPLKEVLKEYLSHSSLDGHIVRKELREKLNNLIK